MTTWGTGAPRCELLHVDDLADARWTARISFEDSLRATYEWYLELRDQLRG